jgi:hypothetical protein
MLRSGARTMSPPSRCAGSTTARDARRVGFDFVVEAGLGRGHRDFLSTRRQAILKVASCERS